MTVYTMNSLVNQLQALGFACKVTTHPYTKSLVFVAIPINSEVIVLLKTTGSGAQTRLRIYVELTGNGANNTIGEPLLCERYNLPLDDPRAVSIIQEECEHFKSE